MVLLGLLEHIIAVYVHFYSLWLYKAY